jgi:alkyl hydroperoxide reductase subunit AhpC
VRGWPTIYVVDHKGVIRFMNVRGEAMDKAVDELLAEMVADSAGK